MENKTPNISDELEKMIFLTLLKIKWNSAIVGSYTPDIQDRKVGTLFRYRLTIFEK
jgi:hypothetical protein